MSESRLYGQEVVAPKEGKCSRWTAGTVREKNNSPQYLVSLGSTSWVPFPAFHNLRGVPVENLCRSYSEDTPLLDPQLIAQYLGTELVNDFKKSRRKNADWQKESREIMGEGLPGRDVASRLGGTKFTKNEL